MNIVTITGKIEEICVLEDRVQLKVRVQDIPTKSSSLIRCSAYGNLINYINYELKQRDEVLINGRLMGKTIKTESGFTYFSEVRVRYICRLDQVEYGAYNDTKND